MAELRAYLTAPDATLIKLRLDAYAKAMPAEDERTMDQRRADILRDLLLDRAAGPIKTIVHITVPATVLADTSPAAAAAHEPCDGDDPCDTEETAYVLQAIRDAYTARTSIRQAYNTALKTYRATHPPTNTPNPTDLATDPATNGPGTDPAADETGTAGAPAPAGPAAAGEHTAVLAGYGTITAGQARELAARDGATWHRILTDPASGIVLDYGRTTYAPPAGLADFVRARDPNCIFPGCNVPSNRCDLDHRIPWPKGPTSADNLAPLCRRHHQLKHDGEWRVHKRPDGYYVWTSPAEIEYLNRPEPITEPEPTTDQDTRLSDEIAPPF
jgi:hypothetical protein